MYEDWPTEETGARIAGCMVLGLILGPIIGVILVILGWV